MADGDLVLEYSGSLSGDNLKKTSRRHFKAVSPTPAVNPKAGPARDVYIHANSNVTVRRGTSDVSRYYAVRRLMRVWSAPLDAGTATRAGAYQLDQKMSTDSAEKPLGDWIDAPGTLLLYRQTQEERLHRCVLQSDAPPQSSRRTKSEQFEAAHGPRRRGLH
jgi:hypothetical protein